MLVGVGTLAAAGGDPELTNLAQQADAVDILVVPLHCQRNLRRVKPWPAVVAFPGMDPELVVEFRTPSADADLHAPGQHEGGR